MSRTPTESNAATTQNRTTRRLTQQVSRDGHRCCRVHRSSWLRFIRKGSNQSASERLYNNCEDRRQDDDYEGDDYNRASHFRPDGCRTAYVSARNLGTHHCSPGSELP
jgi:hypothetical protein